MTLQAKKCPLTEDRLAFIESLKVKINQVQIRNKLLLNSELSKENKTDIQPTKHQPLTLSKGYDSCFYEVPIEQLFSETELKPLAQDLYLIVQPDSYKFEIDPNNVTIVDGKMQSYGLKPSELIPDNWREEAKFALRDFRLIYPSELLKACTKYLDNDTKKILIDLVQELNNEDDKSCLKNSINLTDNTLNNESKNTNKEYYLINSNEELNKAILLINEEQFLGIDIETTGLDPHINKIRLIQIASVDKPTIIIDCFKCNINLIQPLLNNNAIKIFHNAKFDIKFFLKQGLNINQKIFDTMLASQLLKAGLNNQEYSLKAIAKEYLEVELNKEEQLSNWELNELTEEQLIYATNDAKILLKLRDKLKEQLSTNNLSKIAQIEFDCINAVAQIELNGMLLHFEKLNQIIEDTEVKKAKVAEKIKQLLLPNSPQLSLLGYVNNLDLDSPKQLKEALNNLGINVKSTDFKTLSKLAPNYEVIRDILEYRKLAKILSSFGINLTNKINPITGRIHTNLWQCGVSAGRFSCSNPNLQQVPRTKEIRSCFIAAPGNKLVIADYSQIELRIAAEVANDETMIQAYKSNADLHKLTASLILNKPMEEVTKGDRQIAKSANFALIYASSVQGFRSYAESNYGISLTELQAKTIRDNFFKSYSGLAKWHQQTKKTLYSQGVSETRTLSERRRYFDNPSLQQVLNTPIQGTAADILKLALAKLPNALVPYKAKIIGTVHDEIILEVIESEVGEVAKILTEVMELAGKEFLKKIPVIAEASICDDWSEK